MQPFITMDYKEKVMYPKAIAPYLFTVALLLALPCLYAQSIDASSLLHTDNPRLKEIVEENIDGEILNYSGKTSFTYSPQDSPFLSKISRYRYFSDYIEYERCLIEHDDSGLIQSVITYRIIDSTLIPFIETISSYDDEERLSEMEVYIWDGDQREKSDIIEMDYDALDETILTQYTLSDGEVSRRHQSIYSFVDNRLYYELYQNSIEYNNYVISGEKRFVYHDEDSSTRADLEQALTKYLPLKYTPLSFEYPALITEALSRIKTGMDWSPNERILTEYDSSLQKLSVERQLYYSYDWHPHSKTSFFYDAQGILHHTLLHEYSTGLGYQPTKKYSYFYHDYVSWDEPIPPAAFAIHLYPSPFYDEITLKVESREPSIIHYEIFNIRGQRVRKLSALSGAEYIWDGCDSQGKALSPGIYLLKATTNNNSVFRKVIKQR